MKSPNIFLEHCLLPSTLSGSKLNLENLEIPLVGITGYGSEHKRKGKQSIWINGLIISPNFTSNNNCASQSYIEGIVTDKGEMKFLEAVSNFPAYEGDYFEYNLSSQGDSAYNSEFEGELFSRLKRNQNNPQLQGNVKIIINPFGIFMNQGRQ